MKPSPRRVCLFDNDVYVYSYIHPYFQYRIQFQFSSCSRAPLGWGRVGSSRVGTIVSHPPPSLYGSLFTHSFFRRPFLVLCFFVSCHLAFLSSPRRCTLPEELLFKGELTLQLQSLSCRRFRVLPSFPRPFNSPHSRTFKQALQLVPASCFLLFTRALDTRTLSLCSLPLSVLCILVVVCRYGNVTSLARRFYRATSPYDNIERNFISTPFYVFPG